MPPCCHQSGARTRWKVRTSSSTCTQIPIAAVYAKPRITTTARTNSSGSPQGAEAARRNFDRYATAG